MKKTIILEGQWCVVIKRKPGGYYWKGTEEDFYAGLTKYEVTTGRRKRDWAITCAPDQERGLESKSERKTGGEVDKWERDREC